MLLKKAGALVLLSMSAQVFASTPQIMERLGKLVSHPEAALIEETSVKGLYQVTVDTQVVYMSADGQFLFSGNMVDLNSRQNLTEEAQAKAYKKVLASFDEKSMIVYPAKNKTQHTVTIFTDIDCPYCVKLHQEIPALNDAGVTVRYMSYPRAGVGSPSYQKAVSVWCASDRGTAMNDAMHKKAVSSQSCDNPVKSHMQQVERLGISGTPAILLDSGRLIPGYVPSKELLKMLNK